MGIGILARSTLLFRMGRRSKRLHRPWLNWLAGGALVLLVCALCTIAASGGSQHTSAQAPTLNTPYRAGAPRAAAETPGYTFSEAANEVYPQRRHHARVGRPTSLPPDAAVAARLAMAVSRAPRVARASGPTPTGRDPDQLASLRALYAGTAGPLWTRAVNWTATDNYCLFAGVDCDDTGNVVRLCVCSLSMQVHWRRSGCLTAHVFPAPGYYQTITSGAR